MTAPAWFALAGLVSTGGPVPAGADAAPYAGTFSDVPAFHWRAALPGPPLATASHTELASPLLVGAHIYVGAANQDALLVLERHSGRLVQRLDTGAPVQTTPVLAAGILYFSDTAGTTYAWPLGAEAPLWAHPSRSPVVAPVGLTDDKVLVADVDDVVVALDRATGDLLWRHAQKLDPTRHAALQLYGATAPLVHGEWVLAGFSDGSLVGLDLADGELAWSKRLGEGRYPDVLGAPVAHGKDFIVAAFTEPLVALDQATRNVRWRVDAGGAWSPVLGGGEGAAPAPVLAGPHRWVFHSGADGKLRCVDAASGAVAWVWDSGSGTALTQAVPTEAGLLVGSSGGSVFLVDTATGALRWRWEPGYHPSGVTAAIAVEGRQAVLVTNAGVVTSFVVPPPARPAPDFGRRPGAP
jgi:outer membrane protein assembly factor BamB